MNRALSRTSTYSTPFSVVTGLLHIEHLFEVITSFLCNDFLARTAARATVVPVAVKHFLFFATHLAVTLDDVAKILE